MSVICGRNLANVKVQHYLSGNSVSPHKSVKDAFSRFYHYAQMVRSLRWENWRNIEWTERLSMFAQVYWLGPALDGRFPYLLLPSLRTLHWTEESVEYFPIFMLFLGPKLEHLHLQSDGPRSSQRAELLSLIAVILRKSTERKSFNLQSLSVQIADAAAVELHPDQTIRDLQKVYDDARDDFSSTLPVVYDSEKHPKLTHVNIDIGLPLPSVLCPAFIARTITSLSLVLDDPFLLSPPTLPQLTSLTVSFVHPGDDSNVFMRDLRCPKLQHLGVSFGVSRRISREDADFGQATTIAPGDPASFRLAVDVYNEGICLADYHATVTSVDITFLTGHYALPAIAAHHDQTLFLKAVLSRPFPKLKALSINVDRFVVTRRMLGWQLTQTCENLEELHVMQPYHSEHHNINTEITLKNVQTALLKLPKLRALSLAFSADRIRPEHGPGPWGRNQEGNVPCRSLRAWQVYDSAPKTFANLHGLSDDHGAECISDWIRLAFPEVLRIDYDATVEGTERWNLVNKYLVKDHHKEHRFYQPAVDLCEALSVVVM